MRTEPLPNGQMPANARNSVLLPEPEGPRMSTDLRAGQIVALSWGDAARCPFGQLER